MAAHVPTPSMDAVVDVKERRIAVESALGSTLAEGVSPSPAVLNLSERYASGEINLEEFSSSVRALYGL